MQYGAQSEYRKMKALLLHKPGPQDLLRVTKETLPYYNFGSPVDPERFLADYDKMVDAFSSVGVEIIFLGDVLKNNSEAMNYIARRPNLVYMRDMATVYDKGAVVMYPYLKGRQWDNWVVTECFKKLGIPVLGEIKYPAYLEGGGVGFLDDRTGYMSICDRANEDAVKQMASFTLGRTLDRLVVVNLPQGYIHIDGLFMATAEKTAFIVRQALEISPTIVIDKNGGTRHVWFPDYVEEMGFELIDGPYGYDMNFVAYEPNKLIGYEKYTACVPEMKKRGGSVTGIPGDELEKGCGGVHCMTCPVLRV